MISFEHEAALAACAGCRHPSLARLLGTSFGVAKLIIIIIFLMRSCRYWPINKIGPMDDYTGLARPQAVLEAPALVAE